MIAKLVARAERVARAEQMRRLDGIAGALRQAGVAAEAGADSLRCEGRQLKKRWLADPLFRFAARITT